LLVGGEVVDTNGDTIHIVDVVAFRENPSGDSWSFETVPDYLNLNSNQIARSDDPSSWPSIWIDKMDDPTDPGWSGSWNSFWGKDSFLANQEFYYHMSDDLYDRHSFYPDSTDSTRRGLGIVVSQRVMEFDLFPDEVFFITDIYNVGDHDIEKAGVLLWNTTFLSGGYVHYDSLRQALYFLFDSFAAAIAFIQTPFAYQPDSTELGIISIIRDPAFNINWNTVSDEFIWTTFMTPGSFYIPGATGDWNTYISTSYFPLPAGQFQRPTTAMVFGQDTAEVNNKIDVIRTLFRYMTSEPPYLNVSVLAPAPGDILSGQENIEWNIENNNPDITLSIFFSDDYGRSWKPLANDIPNTGSYSWNTMNYPDGILNKIKIVAWRGSVYGMQDSDSIFTINNAQPAAPQILVTSPQENQTYQGTLPIEWIAGDADGDTVQIDLFYTIKNTTISDTIVTGLGNSGSYNWETLLLPNSAFYKLQAIISDAQLFGVDSVQNFEILNPRINLSDSALTQRNIIGSGIIEVHIVDPSQLTGHNYTVQFNVPSGGPTTYDVRDENIGIYVITGATQVNGITEGPLFDGIRLFIQNDSTELNHALSGWNNSDVFDFIFGLFHFITIGGIPDPADYRVEIGNVGIDTSTAYTIPVTPPFPIPSKPVNFKIINTTIGQPIDFAFFEIDGNDGRFTVDTTNANRTDQIIFLKKDDQDSLVTTWTVLLHLYSSGNRNPQIGDTLYLNLFKSFQDSDYYSFEAIPSGIVDENVLPTDFVLYHNYPNPFNTETTVRFQIGSIQKVSLVIYDVLGRKVRTLVDENLVPGEYSIKWNGHSDEGKIVASGVYFYHLKANDSKSSSEQIFVKTRKMLYLK
jgi:hypothetical protein